MIELRIPISPTFSFLNRAVLLVESFRRFYPDTIARIYIGQTEGLTSEAVGRISYAFHGRRIGFEWLTPSEFNAWEGTRSPYIGTMNRRFKIPVDGDHVIIADCDVLLVNRIDELFETDAVQGVMAHVAPLPPEDMRYLYVIDEAPWPEELHPFSGNGVMGPPDAKSPWYVNSGFCFAPKHLFEQLIEPYHEAIFRMRHVMRDTYWFDQLALALAVAKSRVPSKVIPLRYNFPNQAAFDLQRPAELDDVRILHYLREDTINRTTDFESFDAMWRLSRRKDLTGSNEVLRKTVAELLPVLEPASLSRAEDAPYA